MSQRGRSLSTHPSSQVRPLTSFSERGGGGHEMRKQKSGVWFDWCLCRSRPLKLYGQFYLLIGRDLLQTEYMAGPLITEVRSDLSAATGKRRAPFLLSQSQVLRQQRIAFYSAELWFYIRVYYQVVCSEFVYGGNFLLSAKLSFERHKDRLPPRGGQLCGRGGCTSTGRLLDTPS